MQLKRVMSSVENVKGTDTDEEKQGCERKEGEKGGREGDMINHTQFTEKKSQLSFD